MPAAPDDPTHSVAPDRDATWDAPPAARAAAPRESAGSVVGGRYTLIECVGEGGMGQVWSARQTAPVKRLVAVKLVKAGMDSKAVLARFEAERQALAVMDHPNIAKILDGGLTDSGAPFFVMELVKGVPITQYCDERQLTPARRLELFVPVCEAIQHAHQKGVIHRDIKPSNVLVAETDAGPVPQVIDFGLAKATHEPLTDLTFQTRVGGLLGTPQYMSPEQASLSGTDIDTRSDVYSLGVLLYELLAGSPPFLRKDLEKAAVYEVLRVVRDEEPPKPSTKLSSADARPSLSACRGTDPKALAKLLRSELDWVVMKALEKDRARRYDSATAFAADVRRYLAGEAVLAHPPSAAYRLRKSLRKNRGPVAAASLVALALVAGVVGTTAGLLRAEQQRALAETRREQAETAEALAEARLGEAEVAKALAEKRRSERSFEWAMGSLLATTGEDVERLIGSDDELGPKERAYLESIIRRWEDFAKATGDAHEARHVDAEGAYRVARLQGKLGKQDVAIAGYHRAISIWQTLAAGAPAVVEYRSSLAYSRSGLGTLLSDQGKATEAEAEFRAALAIQEELVADFPAAPGYLLTVGISYLNIALQFAVHDLNDSLQWYEQAITTLTAVVQQQPDDVTAMKWLRTSHFNRSLTFHVLKLYYEAIHDYTRAIELSSPKERASLQALRVAARLHVGQHAQAFAELSDLTMSDTNVSVDWYHFACAYAVASSKLPTKREECEGRALELLGKAVAKGFNDTGQIATDADLDPLRGRADFRKLVADLEARHPRPLELAPPPRPAE